MSEQEFGFEPPIDGGIVVGVDGSPRADRALRWAVAEAALRAVPLHVVRAWAFAASASQVEHPFGVVPSFEACASAVQAELDEEVTAALGGVTPPSAVFCQVVHAEPAEALLRASAGADLLVVGDRGHSGLLGLLLGSVATQVLKHATCPVVVVRGDATAERT
jgi:nucleotide-binding universal stress UspA family protein